MKIVKLTILLIVIISSSAFSQSIRLFNVDASDFPLMRAKFYALDEAGNQQRPSISELSISEYGLERAITNVSCPPAPPPRVLSSVLTIDISGSMAWGNPPNLRIAQEAAHAWVAGLPLGKSECAITTFNSGNYLNHDFTKDRGMLLSTINRLSATGGTDYDAALLNPAAGGLLISKNGKYQKVIVMLTDGMAKTPDINRIINEANSQNCTIYSVTLGIACPLSLKEISNQTDGKWYENVTSVEHAKAIYMEILQTEQGGVPCTIEWESGAICKAGLTNVELHWNSTSGKSTYIPPISTMSKLEYYPTIIRFDEPEPGVWQSKTVRVTAINGHFVVTDIEESNPSFEIDPKSFILEPDESIDLTISYLPIDLGYSICRFNLINETCPSGFYARGGIPGMQATEKTIKLIHPNGGEVFVVGSDTVITWEGVSEYEPIKIEYRTSDEEPWITITESARGLNHPFRVPSIESDVYLARVTAKNEYDYCEVEIGNQIWMCENLDVTHYRNGDEIPQVQDSSEWEALRTGAWCYYANDPVNGAIYGKLYNWYAFNDPRGLAPEGWRVPSDEDWRVLEIAMGMHPQSAPYGFRGIHVGAKLAGGYDLWASGDLRFHKDFNSSGFSGLPGGYRDSPANFYNIREGSYWWSSTESISPFAIYRGLQYLNTRVFSFYYIKRAGFSVRCLRDE